MYTAIATPPATTFATSATFTPFLTAFFTTMAAIAAQHVTFAVIAAF
jgi:hypothetical protein